MQCAGLVQLNQRYTGRNVFSSSDTQCEPVIRLLSRRVEFIHRSAADYLEEGGREFMDRCNVPEDHALQLILYAHAGYLSINRGYPSGFFPVGQLYSKVAGSPILSIAEAALHTLSKRQMVHDAIDNFEHRLSYRLDKDVHFTGLRRDAGPTYGTKSMIYPYDVSLGLFLVLEHCVQTDWLRENYFFRKLDAMSFLDRQTMATVIFACSYACVPPLSCPQEVWLRLLEMFPPNVLLRVRWCRLERFAGYKAVDQAIIPTDVTAWGCFLGHGLTRRSGYYLSEDLELAACFLEKGADPDAEIISLISADILATSMIAVAPPVKADENSSNSHLPTQAIYKCSHIPHTWRNLGRSHAILVAIQRHARDIVGEDDACKFTRNSTVVGIKIDTCRWLDTRAIAGFELIRENSMELWAQGQSGFSKACVTVLNQNVWLLKQEELENLQKLYSFKDGRVCCELKDICHSCKEHFNERSPNWSTNEIETVLVLYIRQDEKICYGRFADECHDCGLRVCHRPIWPGQTCRRCGLYCDDQQNLWSKRPEGARDGGFQIPLPSDDEDSNSEAD